MGFEIISFLYLFSTIGAQRSNKVSQINANEIVLPLHDRKSKKQSEKGKKGTVTFIYIRYLESETSPENRTTENN